MLFINRDYTRTENDDFKLNVLPILTDNNEAVPLYCHTQMVGWAIQNRYE